MTAWTPGNREKALEALRIVLGGIDGVQTVRREPPPRVLNLSDNELPAIFVDDSRTAFNWLERHGRNLIRTQSAIVLDCHALATSVQGDHRYANGATLRNLFARRIMLELTEKATLVCQIPGVDEEDVAHCRSVARSFQINTVPIPFPYVRFQIIIELDVDDVLDPTVRTQWKNAILTVQPERPGEILPSEKEVTFPALSLRDWFTVNHADELIGLWSLDDLQARDAADNGYDLTRYEPDKGDIIAGRWALYRWGRGSMQFGGGCLWRRMADADAADFDFARGSYKLANIARADSFSVVALTRRDADTGGDQAIAGWRGPSGAYWQLYTNDDGETRVRMLGNDDGNAELDAGGGSGETGDIDLHMAVVDRTADELRIYQNGTLVSTTSSLTASVGGLESVASALFAIGATATGPATSAAIAIPTAIADDFRGRIELVGVVGTALATVDATELRDIADLG